MSTKVLLTDRKSQGDFPSRRELSAFKILSGCSSGRIVGKLNNGSFVIGRVIADGSFPSVVLAPL